MKTTAPDLNDVAAGIGRNPDELKKDLQNINYQAKALQQPEEKLRELLEMHLEIIFYAGGRRYGKVKLIYDLLLKHLIECGMIKDEVIQKMKEDQEDYFVTN